MKKRDKKLKLAKETLQQLESGKDMMFVAGGVEIMSCTFTQSTQTGSRKVICC